MTADIRVMTYNIHKGMDFFGSRNITQGIKTAIQRVNPDVVFLQEVIGASQLVKHRLDPWPSTAQFEFLADSIWPHFAYGKNAVYSDRDHGNAILSRYPIIFNERIDVSTNRFEKRGLLHAVCEIPRSDRQLDLICVHNDLLEIGRNRQIHALVQRITASVNKDRPLIVAGDFNDWRQSSSKRLKSMLPVQEAHHKVHGHYARTFPVFFPMLPLDRIYYMNLTAVDAQTHLGSPWGSLSDHAALQADFRFL